MSDWVEMADLWVTSSIWELAGGRASLASNPGLVPVAIVTVLLLLERVLQPSRLSVCILQLSATDISAQASMKGAAKCDNHCELQNSVNQWIFERALHSRDIPGSMPASVLVESSCRCGLTWHVPVSLCATTAALQPVTHAGF